MKTEKNKNVNKRPQIRSVKELEKYMRDHRSEDMLTVQDLIDFLKTQNPNACILAYEPNSQAYIEQLKKLPNESICTVKEDKKTYRTSLKQWYKGYPPDVAKKKISESIKEMYRYAEDDDVVLKFS